jgi:hypothetical protein
LCRSIVSLKLFYCEKTWLGGTVTGWVCEKIAQNVAKPVYCQN